jgi:hypothetical protein
MDLDIKRRFDFAESLRQQAKSLNLASRLERQE